MRCSLCSTELPLQARFCLNCGAPIIDRLTPDQKRTEDRFSLLQDYIPAELAKKILTAGKKIESERRHVTVLFADVTGFTALSEKLDLEVVSTVLNDCFRGLISTVLKYEGTIDKFIGDGIMAIFGAPLAHENDPERAVRCSLEMLHDIERYNALSDTPLPAPLSLHVGLHSGMVIAGNVGSDLRMNYSVLGDTVNLASRLVELAPPGEIYMSSETFKLVSNLVIAEGPVATPVKGKLDPVSVYKVQSLKAEVTRKPIIARDEFVGRVEEKRQVSQALEQVLKRKHTCLFIRGEAGVGKTRLKIEILKMAKEQGIATIEGKCSSFEVNTPYYLWNTLLKGLLKLGLDSSELEARIRLHELVQFFSLEEHEPYLATLLSLRYEQILLEEEHFRKKRIFEAIAKLMNTFAARRPTLFIIEDLHWIDKFSQELLEYILANTTSVPGLIVALFRDEYVHQKSILDFGELLDLNRLNREDAIILMKLRLDVDAIPEKVADLVLVRSEGNPFFIQEMLKTLLDRKVIAVRARKVEILNPDMEGVVPTTIQGVIMARIDRIQEGIKDVLYSASVIGREFSKPLLEKVVEKPAGLNSSLNELQSLELVLEKEEALDFEYFFKHYLIQEVAYNTILLNKRKELHAGIAHAIETLYADRLVEFYELLAFHYEKAEEWDKAAEYLGRSGNKVMQIYSGEESKNFFERKEVAMQKLFQSGSAKWSFMATIKAIFPPLLAMLIPIMPIFAYVRFLGRTRNPDVLEIILLLGVASLLCLWYAVSLWYLGVVPFLRGRPKLYDLMEDQVRALFRDGTNLSIHFSEIDGLRFFDPGVNKARPFKYKIIDPLSRIENYENMTFGKWIKEVFNILPPYSFGFGSKQGEIHIRLKEGFRAMRVVIPWFNTPVRSKDMSLLPFAPKEFFDQLQVALEKWKRTTSQKKSESVAQRNEQLQARIGHR